MAKKKKESEERKRVAVEISWRDCFKLWVANLIVFSLPMILLVLVVYAAR